MGEVGKKIKNYKNTGAAVVYSRGTITELSKSAFTPDKWM